MGACSSNMALLRLEDEEVAALTQVGILVAYSSGFFFLCLALRLENEEVAALTLLLNLLNQVF